MEKDKFVVSIPEEYKISVTAEDVRMASDANMTLSTYLNEKHREKLQLGIDAFDMALLSAGIIAKGDAKLGVQSSTMDKFFTTSENRILFPEFMVRTIKASIMAPSIMQYLIGETQTITGDTMRQPTLDLTSDTVKKAMKKRRITEGAEIPVTSLKLAETAISIYKYGTGVKASYEVLRRTTIDMFRKTIELIATFAAYDQVDEIIDVIINGDGNNNAATEYKRSVLNTSGASGVLDDTTLLKFLVKLYPISIDTLVVGEDLFIQLVSATDENTLVNGVTPYVPFSIPQGILKGLTIIYDPNIPVGAGSKNRVIGLNKSLAIRKLIEQNSMIQELATFANDQTKSMYITENAGFGKIYNEASATLLVD